MVRMPTQQQNVQAVGAQQLQEFTREEREREIYFSTVKILAQRPTDVSAVATVLLITKTFIVRDRDRQIDR